MPKKILLLILAAALLTGCAGPSAKPQTTAAESSVETETAETEESEETEEDEDLLFDEDETLGDPEEGDTEAPLLAEAAASVSGVIKKYKKQDYILKKRKRDQHFLSPLHVRIQ